MEDAQPVWFESDTESVAAPPPSEVGSSARSTTAGSATGSAKSSAKGSSKDSAKGSEGSSRRSGRAVRDQCFIVGCDVEVTSVACKFCAVRKRIIDVMRKNSKGKDAKETFTQLLSDAEALSAEVSALMKANPLLGVQAFTRCPPLDWARIGDRMYSRAYVQDSSVLKKVDRIEYGCRSA
jgi:hypothetical protein